MAILHEQQIMVGNGQNCAITLYQYVSSQIANKALTVAHVDEHQELKKKLKRERPNGGYT